MTKETIRRLYKHYKDIGYEKALKDLIDKRPWILEEEAPKETNSKKTKKEK